MKSKVSKKFIFGTTLIVFASWIMMNAGVSAWYKGVPETLFGRRRGIEFCIGCGTQQSYRSNSLFNETLVTSRSVRNPVRTPENLPARNLCNHIFVAIYREDLYLDLATFKLKRWSIGLPNDTTFWENPVLIQSLATVRGTSLQHSWALFNQINLLRQQRRIPKDIQAALVGTNSVLVTQLLIESSEKDGRRLPKTSAVQPKTTMVNIPNLPCRNYAFALVEWLILIQGLVVVASLAAIALSSVKRKVQ